VDSKLRCTRGSWKDTVDAECLSDQNLAIDRHVAVRVCPCVAWAKGGRDQIKAHSRGTNVGVVLIRDLSCRAASVCVANF